MLFRQHKTAYVFQCNCRFGPEKMTVHVLQFRNQQQTTSTAKYIQNVKELNNSCSLTAENRSASEVTVKPVLNWANVCSPKHTSDTSTNYDLFFN